MNDVRHLDDEIQDLLDGRLDEAERAKVEEHLASCAACSAQRDRLVAVKTAAWRALRQPEAPSGVSAAITAALDREQAAQRRRWRMAAAAAVLAAIVGLVTYLRRPGLPDAAASDFARVADGSLVLESSSSDPASLERFFQARGIAFRTRVLDLGMMGYRLIGGRVHSLRGRPSALFVYRGPEGRLLVCEMYLGSLEELPSLARRVVEHGGFEFRAYRRGGSTQVFWQEGDVTCVLVSDAPLEEVLALAFAKAMKPA
jgi:anti-sigma factor RsiW